MPPVDAPRAPEPTHEIHIAAQDAWSAMQAIAATFAPSAARLAGIQGARFAGGAWSAVLRVEGVAPNEARRLADQLAASHAVSTARVEHVLWRTKN